MKIKKLFIESNYKKAFLIIEKFAKNDCIDCIDSLKKINFVKNAFDTRKINQETEINPRRNLQFYTRSESDIHPEIYEKLKHFKKLSNACNNIYFKFYKTNDYLDSFSKSLKDNLDRILRMNERDMDFQIKDFDFLEQLLTMRYKLSFDELKVISEDKLESLILSKDKVLIKNSIRDILYNDNIKKADNNLEEKNNTTEVNSFNNINNEKIITITVKC